MSPKFLPLNVRVRLLDQDAPDANARVSLMCAMPVPGKLGVVKANPGVLEIALIDPDDGKEKWYEVPFYSEPKSVIELDVPRGKRN